MTSSDQAVVDPEEAAALRAEYGTAIDKVAERVKAQGIYQKCLQNGKCNDFGRKYGYLINALKKIKHEQPISKLGA
jgi:hypothetical protein